MRITNVICACCLFAIAPAYAGGRAKIIGSDRIDFGRYDASAVKTARYRINNTGKDNLEILKTLKTCGCATAKIDRTILKPGQNATLEVVIQPNSICGPYNEYTYLQTSDPNHKYLKLTVSGNAVPLVNVEPDNYFNAGRIPLSNNWQQVFTLTPTRPGVRLGKIQTTSSHPLKTELIHSDTDSSYRVEVQLEPASASGNLDCSISIPVLMPTNESPVTIHIDGRLGNELNAVPGTLYIPHSGKPIIKKFYLRMLGNEKRQLNPDDIVLPDNSQVSFDLINNKSRQLLVKAMFSPEFTEELMMHKEIILEINIKDAASARIRCRLQADSNP